MKSFIFSSRFMTTFSKFLPPLFFVILCISYIHGQGVLIGDTANAPHPGAALEIRSSQKALLLPRMNTTQRNAIPSPTPGMMLYNTLTKCIETYMPTQGWTSMVCDCNTLPSPSFTASATNVNINQSVNFITTTTGVSYQWTFTGGNPAVSTTQNPSVTWGVAGTYTAKLRVTTPNGCSDSSTQTITVNNCLITPGSQTFNFTGSATTFTVPACVTTLQVQLFGAAGGTRNSGPGGLGASVTGTLAVTPGQIIHVYVGGAGANTQTAGWNGGGVGDFGAGGEAGGGGGASDLRVGGTALSNRVAVAAGGGGSGWNFAGGAGGGTTGNNGSGPYPGFGATQSAGGVNGTDFCSSATSSPGSLGQGGNGGGGGCGSGGGGGGGGGYYGGGGGGTQSGNLGSGGGGGSSFTGGLSSPVTQTGVRAGNGQIIISWP